jgi:dihydroxyacetone kinase-like predicted kinase
VIVLPNNKNVLPAAESVGELVRETEVYVVPTTSVACGLAAMVGYDAEGEPLEVAGEMREIVNGLRCAEVTVAVRDAKVEGKEVRKGEYIGFLYGKLWAVEKSAREVALVMVGEILEEATDVVTLLRGEGLTERDAEEIAGEIRDAGGVDLLVEVKDGGHPLYPLQVAAE